MKHRIIAILALALALAVGASVAAAQEEPSSPETATVAVTVWQSVARPEKLYLSTRPEGGRWRTRNTALDMSMRSHSGWFHQSNAVLVGVPLGGGATVNVEVTVWRRIADPSQIFVSTRPEGGHWRTRNTALDMSMRSRSGRFHQSDIVFVAVPLPSAPTAVPVARTTFTGVLPEVEYSIGLAEGWNRTAEHVYQRSDPWGVLYVAPIAAVGRTLPQYAALVRKGLKQEVQTQWPAYALFEFIALEEITVGGETFYELRYRRQESSQHCAVSVVERVAATAGWHGFSIGMRAISWLCEDQLAAQGASRQATLDTLWVSARPYYTQALLADGVFVKAAPQVDPDALSAAAGLIGWMLETAREDVAPCMAAMGAGLAIIPKDEFVTSLPEFAFLAGKMDFTGRSYASYDIRGLGAVREQPVSATSEETLLGIGGPRDLNVTVHEFAHAIQSLCFTPDDHEEWNSFHSDVLAARLYPGTHAMHDVHEFFAVFSSSYFGVTDELGDRSTSKEMIRDDFPDIFASLEDLYGTPGPPPEQPATSEE